MSRLRSDTRSDTLWSVGPSSVRFESSTVSQFYHRDKKCKKCHGRRSEYVVLVFTSSVSNPWRDGEILFWRQVLINLRILKGDVSGPLLSISFRILLGRVDQVRCSGRRGGTPSGAGFPVRTILLFLRV